MSVIWGRLSTHLHITANCKLCTFEYLNIIFAVWQRRDQNKNATERFLTRIQTQIT